MLSQTNQILTSKNFEQNQFKTLVIRGGEFSLKLQLDLVYVVLLVD